MVTEVKFTGKFRDLKGRGFKFMKLFASNYKVYRKDDIWIWVAHGGYVEFEDLGERSAIVIDLVLKDKYPVFEEDLFFPQWDKPFFKKGEPKTVMIDRTTNEVIAYDKFVERYRKRCVTLESFLNIKYSGRFIELIIHKRHLDAIKEIRDIIEVI